MPGQSGNDRQREQRFIGRITLTAAEVRNEVRHRQRADGDERHEREPGLPRAPGRDNDDASALRLSYPSEPERVTGVQRFANRVGAEQKLVNQERIGSRPEGGVANHLESVLDAG